MIEISFYPVQFKNLCFNQTTYSWNVWPIAPHCHVWENVLTFFLSLKSVGLQMHITPAFSGALKRVCSCKGPWRWSFMRFIVANLLLCWGPTSGVPTEWGRISQHMSCFRGACVPLPSHRPSDHRRGTCGHHVLKTSRIKGFNAQVFPGFHPPLWLGLNSFLSCQHLNNLNSF